MPSIICTLKERIDALCVLHGSLRAAARVVKIDAGYLSRLRDGVKDEPSNTVLRKLGLRKTVIYKMSVFPPPGGEERRD